ncbi:hypothetical protein F4225_03135 [Candidatus Poribacteria bacterium]|nr:hypothetical protein [Candidatus Poribacteria bacterium]
MVFDREGLQDFVDSGDKSPPPVFVGREDILRDIEATARRIRKEYIATGQGNPGETRIIQGAPGAGKSSVIAELRNRSINSPAPQSPLVLSLNSSRISRPENILVPLARLVNANRADEFLARINETLVAGGSVGTSGTKVEGRVESSMTRLDPDPNLTEFEEWVLNLPEDQGIKGPIIVAIDEAQRFREQVDSPLARVLQGIHDGSKLPMMLVLAGLGDTNERARSMELTRGSKVHEIGSLAPEEAGEFMLACCRRFGMDPRGHEERLVELAAPCEGWPRHLHFTLQSLGREALKGDGDLARVSWENVKKQAKESRTRYYQDQQSQEMKLSSSLVGKILREYRPGSKLPDVIDNITLHAGEGTGIKWLIPEGMTAKSLADHLIHRGVFLEKKDHTLSLGIPSFRSYLVEAGGLSLPPPSDDMIREARNHCRTHRKSLREWREQGARLDKELQSAEQDITRKRDEVRKIRFRSLSFGKSQLQKDLIKAEEQLAEIRDRQLKSPPPPMPPSPKTLGIAHCMTTSDAKKEAALEKVDKLEEQQIFFPAKTPVSTGYVTEGTPAETLLFVVNDQSHVMPTGSYGRKWHHFAVWDGRDADLLPTLKEAFPETRMVVEPGLQPLWPGNIPAVESEEANRLMHNAGLSRHLQNVGLARDDPGHATEPEIDNQKAVEQEKDPETSLGTPKMGM